MPLQAAKAGDCRGTEADAALIENGSGPVMRWLARKQIPRLERWR